MKRLSTAVFACLFLVACGGSAAAPAQVSLPAQVSRPAAATNQSDSWQQLVQAAQREGTVSLYGPPGGNYRNALIGPFEQAYPGIKVDAYFGDDQSLVSRITTERAAHKYLADVLVDGTTSPITALKQSGAVAPIRPVLMLPEVLDESAWLQQKLWFPDAAEPYVDLQFEGLVSAPIAYNSKLVDPKQFTSQWDILDPKWKGKIVATDIRRPGTGAAQARYIYKSSDLGPTFLTRLYGETNLKLSSDQRQMIDWLAQGQYAVSIFVSGTEIVKAKATGLPVDVVPAEQLKEKPPVTSGWGSVAILDSPPHPNAAKLYINWLLSKQGQLAWQRETGEPSLRMDIPKDGIDFSPKAGVEYVNAQTEEYGRITSSVLEPLLTGALEKAGQASPK